MSQYTGSIPVEDVHRWKAEATQRLLGFTIGLSDEQWHAPSPLPGWSRAHIATHLARGADRLSALIRAVLAGDPPPPPVSAAERQAELEAGADRGGLDLQIDLDTSAGALQGIIERVTDWSTPVVLHGRDATLAATALGRLHEVCVHHLDLDCALSPDAVDPAAAGWLLRWVLDLRADADLPALQLEGESLTARIGSGVEPRRITGSDARLWAWLSGRLPASGVLGADGLQPGLLA
ncbi:MAG: maleylpyruvate isomerase family mycothiol-dependent enzyme [Propionicimonas sp.]|uniref:maleylpyruvate isomerase family mycothiol-dependent enzyme n=1 Tax=Propionicimonas sp. TaxID=1955623 RepID=UPI003D124CCF